MDYSDPVDSSLSGIALMKRVIEIGPESCADPGRRDIVGTGANIAIPKRGASFRLIFGNGAFHTDAGIAIPYGSETDLGGVKLFIVPG